jgi:putative Holliday junction resolvase
MSRILGIDPGSRRCGVAITDSTRTMAFPRPALEVDDEMLASIVALIDEESVEQVVVGRPVALSGKETASTEMADRLFASLREVLGDVPVIQWDERLTTHEAQRSLTGAGMRAKQHRQHVDSAAAAIMLQNYIDGLRAL